MRKLIHLLAAFAFTCSVHAQTGTLQSGTVVTSNLGRQLITNETAAGMSAIINAGSVAALPYNTNQFAVSTNISLSSTQTFAQITMTAGAQPGWALTSDSQGKGVWAPIGAGGGSGNIASLNSLVNAIQLFTTGLSGSDFGIVSSGQTHTFNLPFASGSSNGKLSSTDWTTFNSKATKTDITNTVTTLIAASNSTLTALATLQTATLASCRTENENRYWGWVIQRTFQTNSQFIESFANLASWGTRGNCYALTNRFYGDGVGSSMNRAFVVPTNSSAQIVGYIVIPSQTLTGTNSMISWCGVDIGTPGASPAANGVGSAGIGIGYNSAFGNPSGKYTPFFDNFGTLSADTNVLSPGTYKVEVNIDPLMISFCLTDMTHTLEVLHQVPRLGNALTNLNNVNLWMSDTSSTNNGSYWTNVAASHGLNTWNPVPWAAGDSADWIIWTKDGLGNKMRIWVPFNYDCRIPARLMYHGHGANGFLEQTVWTQDPGNERPFHQVLVSNNVIEVASDQGGGNTAGNEAAVQCVRAAINYGRTNFCISGIFLMGESFGGPPCLNYISRHYTDTAGFLSWFAVCSLSSMYTNGYNGQIDGAYGITGTGTNTYANMTTFNGQHDPILQNPAVFVNVPMFHVGDTFDGAVPYVKNGLALAAILAPTGLSPNATDGGWTKEQSTITYAVGGHGGPLNFGTNTTSVLNFMARSLNSY